MDFVIFFAALIGLGISGDLLVRGAAGIGTNFKLSKAFVGLTIVSAGTSAPELVISLHAVIGGQSDISMGNVVGSNIINIAGILGLTAIIFPIVIKSRIIKLEWPFMFIATVVFYLLIRDGQLDRLEAGFLFISFIFFMIYLVSISKDEVGDDDVGKERSPMLNLLFLVLGIGGLALAGDFMLGSAGNIARSFGVSDRVIGLTLFAIGTSLPELVTSLAGAYRKENEIVVGNIIGSNVFNILLVLGAVGIIKPIDAAESIIQFDAWWMIGIAAILLPLMYTGLKIRRWEGVFLFSVLIVYFVFLVNQL